MYKVKAPESDASDPKDNEDAVSAEKLGLLVKSTASWGLDVGFSKS